MIISPQRRFILIEIPYAGSAPLARAIIPHLSPQKDLVYSHTMGDMASWARPRFELEKLGINKYSTLADLENVFGVDELRPFQLMTVIRNPFDRLVRYYENLRKWPQGRFGEMSHIAHNQDFSSFARHARVVTWLGQNYASHVRLQSGEEFCHAYLKCDDVKKLNAVLNLLNISEEISEADIQAEAIDYQRYYDQELLDFVAEHAAYDLKRFQYQF